MTRPLISMIGAALLAPVAASAATYSAQPVTPLAAKGIIDNDISWSCSPKGCRGSTEYSRPLILCRGLARQAGPIQIFLVDGHPLPPEEIGNCNRAAKGTTRSTR